MRRTMTACAIALAAAVSGCTPGPELSPAPRANEVSGPGEAATAVEAGVRMMASVDAWEARPDNLEEEVTPILVRITNGSTMPLRVRYDAFQLVSPTGERFAAIPPFDLEGAVPTNPVTPFYPPTAFGVAPYLSPFYPDLTPFTGPFDLDPDYYDTYFPLLAELELPTVDMLQRALPEGVLSAGGVVQGFLYFQEVGESVPGVTFTAALIDARNGNAFGTISIPFNEMDD
ncbi:MAG TPA: hypothetical protein VFI96_03990 [Longimicrobiaceae bacterium]|nr:hypothetical protein [Longimicrobiaceae bacterium]